MYPLEEKIVQQYIDIFLRLQKGYKLNLDNLINNILLNKFDESCKYE